MKRFGAFFLPRWNISGKGLLGALTVVGGLTVPVSSSVAQEYYPQPYGYVEQAPPMPAPPVIVERHVVIDPRDQWRRSWRWHRWMHHRHAPWRHHRHHRDPHHYHRHHR